MSKSAETLELMDRWWNALERYKSNNLLPAKGSVAGALVVLERLKSKYVLDIEQHRAAGKSQIKGAGKAGMKKILAKFGETRPFLSEGGRTNRGLAGDVAKLLETLKTAKLDGLAQDDRNRILEEAQKFLVSKVGEYFSRERVKFSFNPEKTAWQSIHDILEMAREDGKEGQVAQYLVGAKLAMRFPNIKIRNDSYSTSDVQSGSPGDFLVNDTVFHVTVAPNLGHFDKCKQNVADGYRVYILVPDRMMVGTRQNADNALPGKITAQSIESFAAQNLEELSTFSKGKLTNEFRHLLEIYNERVDQIETDKSMLIEIPRNLQKS